MDGGGLVSAGRHHSGRCVSLKPSRPSLSPDGLHRGDSAATEVKVKSPDGGRKKVFPLPWESLRHLLGKGPGALGSLLGKGVRKRRDRSFPSPAPSPRAAPRRCKAQGLWVKGQVKNPWGGDGSGPLVLRLWHSPFLARSLVASEVGRVV